MYKPIDKLQHTFLDFNQPIGLQMNPNNRWIKMADNIPWDVFEGEYAALFPSATGNVAKPLRLVVGSTRTTTLGTYSVKKGELIGYVGTTGNSTGYHLHFEIKINGVRKNPPAYVKLY